MTRSLRKVIRQAPGRLLALAFAGLLAAGCAGSRQGALTVLTYEDRLRLAAVYTQGGQDDKAAPILEDAARRESSRPEAHARLGEIAFRKGAHEEAARHFGRALKAAGEDPVLLNNLAWVELLRGRNDAAEGFIERALRLEPSPRYPYMDTKARVKKALGRRAEALAIAQEALTLAPASDTRLRAELEELIRSLQ